MLWAIRIAIRRGHMEKEKKVVDGFRFLPPGLKAWVQTFIPDEEFKGPIPWTPISKPLNKTIIALVTSAGISLKSDPPFDMEREKKEPPWGDRSFRIILRGTTEKEIEVNHLHINTTYSKQDINVILPLTRMAEHSVFIGSYRTYFQKDETRKGGGRIHDSSLTFLLSVRRTGCKVFRGKRVFYNCSESNMGISSSCRYTQNSCH